MKVVISVLFACLLASSAMAQLAQTSPPDENNMTRIIRDILGDVDIPFPAPPETQTFAIDNIPVSIDIENNAAFEGEWLVVSAHAPPRQNNLQGKGELLGETRLLLRSLKPPFNVVIAAPRAVVEKIEFLDIRGRIEDKNGNTISTGSQRGIHGMNQAASLTLMRTTVDSVIKNMPEDHTMRFEQARGKVDIAQPDNMFRGAILTVQLIESGLAGGGAQGIKGETRLEIDGQAPPFDFQISYTIAKDGSDLPLTLSAFITDWAGRRTHVMAKSLDFNGPNFDYRMKLDAIKQGREVTDFQFSEVQSAANVDIKGRASFNAPKGLPLGSYLKIRLSTSLGSTDGMREIADATIGLDDKTGDVDFTINAPRVNFNPELPSPLMELQILSPAGTMMFESGAAPVSTSAINLVNLSPGPFY